MENPDRHEPKKDIATCEEERFSLGRSITEIQRDIDAEKAAEDPGLPDITMIKMLDDERRRIKDLAQYRYGLAIYLISFIMSTGYFALNIHEYIYGNFTIFQFLKQWITYAVFGAFAAYIIITIPYAISEIVIYNITRYMESVCYDEKRKIRGKIVLVFVCAIIASLIICWMAAH